MQNKNNNCAIDLQNKSRKNNFRSILSKSKTPLDHFSLALYTCLKAIWKTQDGPIGGLTKHWDLVCAPGKMKLGCCRLLVGRLLDSRVSLCF